VQKNNLTSKCNHGKRHESDMSNRSRVICEAIGQTNNDRTKNSQYDSLILTNKSINQSDNQCRINVSIQQRWAAMSTLITDNCWLNLACLALIR